MLYFDDFMEAIENLPSELNESLTNVRHLDLQTQNLLDLLNENVPAFFDQCALGKLSENDEAPHIAEISKDYEKALVYCKEKREIVENIYNTYRKLVRKLDIELEKFRLELEADNSGVTEQIEKSKVINTCSKVERRRQRFKLQQNSHCKPNITMRKKLVGQAFRAAFKSACMKSLNSNQKLHLNRTNREDNVSTSVSNKVQENPMHRSMSTSAGPIPTSSQVEERNRSIVYNEDLCDRIHDNYVRPLSTNSLQKVEEDSASTNCNSYSYNHSLKGTPYFLQDPITDSTMVSPNKSQLGSGNGQMFKTNLPTSNYSYNTSEPSSLDESPLNLDILDRSAVPGWITTTPNISGHRDRKRFSKRPNQNEDLYHHDELGKFEGSLSGDTSKTPDHLMNDHQLYDLGSTTKFEKPNDPLNDDDDEDCKRYCICRDVSYGDMIACDAADCPYEWFHYSCVNLTVAPKGRWFCQNCTKTLANRKTVKKSTSRK